MKLGGLSMTLGVAAALALLIVGASLSTTAGSGLDYDNDGVVDLVDNCLGKSNPVNAQGWQADCDLDGYGDECDGDLNNDGGVGVPDFGLFSTAFLKPATDPDWNQCADFNHDGGVGVPDFGLFAGLFLKPLGPSALACASDVGPGEPNLNGQQRCWFLPTHRVKCPPLTNGDKAVGANDNGILTNSANFRDLRFINHGNYSLRPGRLGAHCVYP